jgi:hypothetical protein
MEVDVISLLNRFPILNVEKLRDHPQMGRCVRIRGCLMLSRMVSMCTNAGLLGQCFLLIYRPLILRFFGQTVRLFNLGSGENINRVHEE